MPMFTRRMPEVEARQYTPDTDPSAAEALRRWVAESDGYVDWDYAHQGWWIIREEHPPIALKRYSFTSHDPEFFADHYSMVQ